MPTELADGVVQLAAAPYLNVTAVRGGNGWTLVDAGVPQTGQRLVDGLSALGIRRGDVERVVLTHGHVDHAGGVARVRDAFGVDEVLVGAEDLAAVRTGTNPPGGLPERMASLPGDLGAYPPSTDAATAADTIVLDDHRRLVPVPTPGHTPGHTAYHLPEDDVVLGGDTLFNVFRLRPAPGFLCSDAPRNRVSVLAIAALAPRTLQLSHGTPVTGDVAGELHALVADS